MRENFYTSGRANTNHSTFGGIIHNYDFEGYNSMGSISGRIISDWKFDDQCRKNSKMKGNKK